ncbi:hypothetical protein [Hymenobacter qilianensis]|uniref:STAS/SEC14 domain-containing protein n=1 Tax=Hymenobacter qilianensis TaxID=1385715 RepID=A0A7H0H175_9BACT|nr:hypothetical protein [Hymenobacter qilianensis]QNP54291.1 hypothetical protein H9L05_20895 [Hymenobacter qilianensis]
MVSSFPFPLASLPVLFRRGQQASLPRTRSAMQLLLYSTCMTLYLHQQGAARAIEAQWSGAASGAMLRQAVLEALTLARQYRITGWIADDRLLLGPLPAEHLAWVAQHVLPQLVSGGVQRFAALAALDPGNTQLLGQAQARAQQQLPFELRTFRDVAAARAWACGLG